MRNLLLLIAFLFSSFASAQQYLQKQDTPIVNTLINAGFENSKSNWVISASSTVTVSTTSPIQGAASLVFDSTAASQTVRSHLYTMPSTKKTGSVSECQAEIKYLTDEPTSKYRFQVLSASNTVVSTVTLDPVSIATVSRLFFTCPTQAKSEIISTGNALPIKLDSLHLGTRKDIVKADIVETLGYEPLASMTAATPLSISISSGASNPALSLQTTGAISGSSYTKVYVDGWGRVTSGTQIQNADLPDSGIAAGTYTKAIFNTKGVATSGTTLINSDLPDSGVIAAVYPKVTVNSKGVVTSGTPLATTDLPFSGVTSGTYTKVQVTSAGTITSGTTLVDTDIPLISADKIASGTLPAGRGGTGFSTYTTGDLLYASGTSLVKLPIGTAAQVLTVTGGSPAWATPASGGASNTYTLQYITSSTTLTTSTHISASALGGPYTVLLPTASSTGTLLTLTKTDAASHVITLQTQFGQTIAASSTSRLNTTDETLSLISSGTAWIILNRTNSSAQLGSGPINITATTTSPTKGAGDYDNVYAVRSGTKTANIEYKYRQGVAGTSGTGDYLFDLPFGLRFDPSRVFFSTSANVYDSIVQGAYLGNGTIGNNTNAGYCTAMAYDATRFRMACTVNFTNHQFFGSSLYGLGGGTVGFSMRLINVPIENWPEK